MKTHNRRTFFFNALGAAAAGGLVSKSGGAAPSDRVNVAVIGVNGMGHFHVKTLSQSDDARIVALGDVDEKVLAKASKTVQDATGKSPNLVGDFRKILDDKTIDAIVIATPHHWHCPIALRAILAGKDVYVEKPASHVFQEGRVLVDLARKHNRVVQHGTQMRSSEVTARAREVLKSGVIGEVKTTKAWNLQRQDLIAAKSDGTAPAGVDYDLWLGPAPKRAFNLNRFHRSWRAYRDYGNGDIGDDGIHDIDMARWALGVTTHPTRITAHGSQIDLFGEREYPDNMLVAYQYGDGKVLIYEDRQWTPYGQRLVDSGNEFYGTKGFMAFSRRGFFQVFLGEKEEKGQAMGTPGKVGQPAPAHMANFLNCVRTRKTTNAPADVAHLSSALVHLGEIAYRVGRVLNFDPATEQCKNDAEANALLTKEYRKPWTLPKA